MRQIKFSRVTAYGQSMVNLFPMKKDEGNPCGFMNSQRGIDGTFWVSTEMIKYGSLPDKGFYLLFYWDQMSHKIINSESKWNMSWKFVPALGILLKKKEKKKQCPQYIRKKGKNTQSVIMTSFEISQHLYIFQIIQMNKVYYIFLNIFFTYLKFFFL